MSSTPTQTKPSRGMRPRKRQPLKMKPAENDEFLWLISLSDLMILLFIFFVVLFAFTRTKIKESDLLRIVATLRNDQTIDPMDQIKKNMDEWLKEQNLNEQVEVNRTTDGIEVQIKDRVAFGSGDFHVHAAGVGILHEFAKTLTKIPRIYSIGIEGHTDDDPIHTREIRDNWDLSAKRAWAMLDALALPEDVQKRVVLMAYGPMKPLVPNRDPSGNPIPANQSRNRRVTIRIF